jgi:hypothetical protein
MRETRLSGSEGGGIPCDSPYPYSDSNRTLSIEAFRQSAELSGCGLRGNRPSD